MSLKTVFRRPAQGLIIAALLAGGAPIMSQVASAQSAQSGSTNSAASANMAAAAEARLRKIEAELRAVQRQVFPGGDGKYFPPEIARGTAAPGTASTAAPATTAVTDLLTRMESVESQLARLTAQSEENGNRIAQLEAKVTALSPPPPPAAPAAATNPAASELPPAAPVSAASASATPASATPVSATPASAASAPLPAPAPRPSIAVVPAAPPAVTPPAPAKPAPAKPAAAKPATATAKPAAPSAARIAAVKAIEKPQSNDPGEDEYSYGYHLWEAKFFPEAVQQLTIFVDKYPRHQRISYARNLLGRAYLDDGKPREAAQWFLKNYSADKKGARAPDSLLMLAEAMTQLKDTTRACLALGEFSDGFSKEAAGRLKGQYDATRKSAQCN